MPGAKRTKRTVGQSATPEPSQIDAEPVIKSSSDDFISEVIRDRDARRRHGKPWGPICCCIDPVLRALALERFSPTKWPTIGIPWELDLELQALDVDRCYLWLQNEFNPATAADFKAKLDSCAARWTKWCSATKVPDDDLRLCADPCTWLVNHQDLFKEFLDIWEEMIRTCSYLCSLAQFIIDKSERERRKSGLAPAGVGKPPEAPDSKDGRKPIVGETWNVHGIPIYWGNVISRFRSLGRWKKLIAIIVVILVLAFLSRSMWLPLVHRHVGTGNIEVQGGNLGSRPHQ